MRAVVVGTGPAGITAAATLRRLDPTGSVVAISAEPYPPYSPAAMADHFLTGRTSTLYWRGEDVCARLGVTERRDTTVAAVDADGHAVLLADGSAVPYEGLVLASGSRLHAPLEGADREGVLDFKSLRTAEALVAKVRGGSVTKALIVGHGLIGVELSLLLRALGVDVTIVGRRPWVMPRILDPVTSARAEAALEARGVRLRLGVEAAAFVGSPSVTGVRLADGELLGADLVVAATGVKPHTEFLAGSGVTAEWGVHVDDELRTSVPSVVAAGDVAEAADWLTGQRYVHAIFSNAVTQGPIAATNLLGGHVRYDGAESMNSLKHLGVPIVAIGTIERPDDVLRYDDGAVLRSVYLRDGRVIGAQLVGDVRGAGVLRTMLLRRTDVTGLGDRLVSPTLSMADLVLEAA